MRIFAAVAMLTMFLFCPIADAWNETGHMTVALIAYRQLSDHQKQQIATILKQHPHYALFLNKDVPDGVNVDEWAFVKAATWPDWVRPSRPGDPMFKNASITHFHHGPWHYIDIPYIADEKSSHIDPTSLPARQEPNILTALDENLKLLQADQTSPADRAVALCWLEHLIGDVHQPLHAATLYSADFPKGDQGGNLLDVRANGYVMRLHTFWDDLLGITDSYVQVDFLASNILAEPQCDPTRMSEYKSDTTFSSWADESYRDAVGVVYLNGRLHGLPEVPNATTRPAADDVPTLPESYMMTARELAERRVALAGFRLADQLKALLKD
jgi:S1/P1 Nuclease